MVFSIVTPSFRSSRWLKLCIASVHDQDLPHEHIVQDSCSDDGTQDWLSEDSRVKAHIEKDNGMYDAVNRGLRRATGDILAYINCDEQYLPGALSRVADFFSRHPDVDVLFAGAVVADIGGNYVCHRQPLLPNRYHVNVCANLPVLTCATFFRRRILERHNLYFDPNLRTAGDAIWVLGLLKVKVKMALLREFTSVFTETGTNLGQSAAAQREAEFVFRSAPPLVRWARPFLVAHHRLRRLAAGHYRNKPFAFALYTEASPHGRVTRYVQKPTFRWTRPDSVPEAA